jgi:spermidine/putrescine transport system substrate-binding protein
MARERTDHPVDRLLAGGPLSRRALLQRMGAAGLTLAGSGALLSACGEVQGTGGDTGGSSQAPAKVNHPKTAIGTLVFANWPLYIDKKVLKTFDRRENADVQYREEINDNDEFFAKVRQELEAGRPIDRDLVVLTDWMARRWIDQGFLDPIDKDNVPNARNLVSALQSPPFDPKRSYTLPWQSGMTAIGYNPKRTGGRLQGVDDLFDPRFKGRVSMLSDWRDSASLVLLSQGKAPEKATKDDYLGAIDVIDQQNRKGQIRRFTGNDYTADLANGNLWASVAYSGDIIQLQADNPDLQFLIPHQGAMLWSDNMMIPKGAKQPYGAETMMNFVYDPEIAARITAYVNYVSPVKGVKEVIRRTDPKLADNELVFPSDATLKRLHPYPSVSAAEEREITAAMQAVTGA